MIFRIYSLYLVFSAIFTGGWQPIFWINIFVQPVPQWTETDVAWFHSVFCVPLCSAGRSVWSKHTHTALSSTQHFHFSAAFKVAPLPGPSWATLLDSWGTYTVLLSALNILGCASTCCAALGNVSIDILVELKTTYTWAVIKYLRVCCRRGLYLRLETFNHQRIFTEVNNAEIRDYHLHFFCAVTRSKSRF